MKGFETEKDFKMSFEYKIYMQSEPWKVISNMVKIRAGYMCEDCFRPGKQIGGDVVLHVHHETYERFGEEDMEDLACLCKGCHANRHRLNGD